MENFNPKVKLLHGLIRVVIASFFLFRFTERDLKHLQNWMVEKGEVIMPTELANFIALCLLLVFVYKMLKSMVVGGLQILTYRKRLAIMGERPVYGVVHFSRRSSANKNIEQAIRYRESAMAGMNSSDAAAYLNSTSRLDSMVNSSNSGPNTKRAASFADSRMAGLNDSDKIKYIQGKIK